MKLRTNPKNIHLAKKKVKTMSKEVGKKKFFCEKKGIPQVTKHRNGNNGLTRSNFDDGSSFFFLRKLHF